MAVAQFHRRLGALEAWLAAALLVAIVALVLVGAIARTLEAPLNWTGDMATFCFAWAVFLCADVAWRRDSLMSFDLLTQRLAAGPCRVLAVVNYALISAFLLYVAGAGLWLSWVSRARSFQGIPEISYSFVTLSMPVGAALLLVTTILKLRATLAQPAQA